MQTIPGYVGCSILIFSCWLVVGARLYTRQFITKSIGIGDLLIVIASLFLTGLIAIIIQLIRIGLSQDANTISAASQSKIFKFYYIGEISYASSSVFLKLSIASLLQHLAIAPIPRKILFWNTVVYTVIGIAFVFILAFQCVPASAFWDRNVTGKCIPARSLVAIIYFHAAVSLVTDGVFAILPIYLVSKLQMSRKMKVSASALLGLGLTTAIVNVSRFFLIDGLATRTNTRLYSLSVASMLELSIGVLAAALATIRPLLRAIPCFSPSPKNAPKSRHYISPQNRNPHGDDSSQRGFAMLDIEGKADKSIDNASADGDSRGNTGINPVMIQVTRDFHVSDGERSDDVGAREFIVPQSLRDAQCSQ